MIDILKNITNRFGEKITEASFEGANIVLYTDNEKFFKEGEGEIKSVVNEIKKRIELRADSKIVLDQKKAELEIRKIVPEEAVITNIIFSMMYLFIGTNNATPIYFLIFLNSSPSLMLLHL